MSAEMTVATFPIFCLTDEREARIMASLDRRRLRKSKKTMNDFFTMRDLARVVLELICERGSRKRPKGFMGYIDVLNDLATKKTIALLNSFAQEDQQQTKSSRVSVQRGSKMSNRRGEPFLIEISSQPIRTPLMRRTTNAR